MNPNPNFWHSKKVLLTGHTGFKGAWMALWLSKLGANVTGISLPPISHPNLYKIAEIEKTMNTHYVDIRDAAAIDMIIKSVKPEVVLHLAAQALVRPSYKDPLATFSTNIMGTANILNSLRGIDSVKAVVVVTTDKVYKNLEHIYPYRETDALGGYDPYSASKAASEIVISSFRDSYLAEQGVSIASARAGNVIGGGDWSEDRLIPDAVRSWDSSKPLEIRRPNSSRPWQHVLEPINGYLMLAEKLYADSTLAGAYNFGPQTLEVATVKKVIEMANQMYGRGHILWGDGKQGPHEAGLLALEISKASKILGIIPRWNLEEAVARTMCWYRNQRDGGDARLLCNADIAEFISL